MKYDELIKNLRECDACVRFCVEYCPKTSKLNKDGKCPTTLAKEAADAIEEMNRREMPMKITEIHVDEYFCPSCGTENNCDQGYVQDAYCPVCGQRLLAEPTKEETDA